MTSKGLGKFVMMSEARHELIANIQVLRGFSALLVVLFHLGPIYVAIGIPQFGGGGVDVFFVISGFIMAHSNLRQPVAPGPFLRNRIRRIVPLYWIITSAVFALALLVPGMMKSTHGSFAEFLKSLFFIPFERDGVLADPVLFLGWTLNYEMFFYLVFALGLAWPGRFCLAFPVLGIAGLVVAGAMLDVQSQIFRFYTDPIMLEFCFGMAIAVVHPFLPSKVSKRTKWALLMMAALGALLVIAIPVFWRDVSRAFLSGAPAVLLVGAAVALEKSGWRVTARSPLLLGASSYSLYLTHIFITELTIRAARLFPLTTMNVALATLAGVILSCVVGWASYRYVETPLLKVGWSGRRVWRGKIEKTAAPQPGGSS